MMGLFFERDSFSVYVIMYTKLSKAADPSRNNGHYCFGPIRLDCLFVSDIKLTAVAKCIAKYVFLNLCATPLTELTYHVCVPDC